ncbi:MAG TPA: MFS transporter [Candidatus Acidoferrales bacterium]|nr:MFS transporter [Candidatus Acidoferrales bacterium]
MATQIPVRDTRSAALRFVLLIGVMSFFADFAYEGARAILGPYLALLGASGAVVGVVAGLGELAGYGLRIVSGRLADRTRQFWPITIFGYVVQMAAVPALALTGSWPAAAALLVTERAGRATRNPPRDVMLSHAGRQMGGFGWAFGLHEALDQFGALCGPLLMALILSRVAHGGGFAGYGASAGGTGGIAGVSGYRLAFAWLAVPALATLALLGVARVLYPRPQEMETHPPDVHAAGLPRVFWIYLAGAALVGAGFADFALVAYHFQKASSVSAVWIPVFYAVAMGVGGAGSLVFGRLFDRYGLRVLIPLTIFSALFAPLVFFGGFWAALGGAAIWGMGMGVHESIVPAAVAPMVPAERRASAYGLFTAGYGLAWFLGSALIGFLYDRSLRLTVTACIVLELAAIPFFLLAARRVSHPGGSAKNSQLAT